VPSVFLNEKPEQHGIFLFADCLNRGFVVAFKKKVMSKKNRNSRRNLTTISEVESNSAKTDVLQVDQSDASKKDWKRKFLYPSIIIALLAVMGLGMMEKNGWLPNTDPLTGKKTGWFGKQLPNNASSSWNPLANPLPVPTPQLTREYLYAGEKLLAVQDAGAVEVPPADIAIWRPSSGEWWVMAQSGSQQTTHAWGMNLDKPVPGDYDGDGKTDFSVFRPSDSNWYILYSSGGGNQIQFGLRDDEVAQADYDGDGRTDAAIYRPSTGTWYVSRSSDAVWMVKQFGLSTDKPVPADYDGDGRADVAFWRSTEAKFYILRSSNEQMQIISFGQAGDFPVPGDYDGDGKADAAVWRGGVY
jgi:hypothetical protein